MWSLMAWIYFNNEVVDIHFTGLLMFCMVMKLQIL